MSWRSGYIALCDTELADAVAVHAEDQGNRIVLMGKANRR
jgi:hypothetical protein